MSVKNCFNRSKNATLKRMFREKIAAGKSEVEAATETIEEYSTSLNNRFTALTGKETNVISGELAPTLVTKTREVVTLVEEEVTPEKKEEIIYRDTQGEAGLRNEVFKYFEIALQSRELYNSMMTSIDNDTTESMVNAMLPKIEQNDLHVFSPKNAVETRFNLKAGQSGIGDMVNANNDHTRSQGREIRFDLAGIDELANEYIDEGYSRKLTDYMSKSDALEILADINKGRKTPLTLEDINRRKITEVLSELTNAFVDIANKDAFITRANWGTIMNNYGTMLLRKGVNPLAVFSIIRNPGVTLLLNNIASREGIVINDTTDNIRKQTEEQLEKKLESISENEDKILPIDALDFKKLYYQAKSQDLKTPEDLVNAISIVKGINGSLKAVRKYSDAVVTAKVGETGIKKSPGDYVVLTNKNSNALRIADDGFHGLHRKYYDNAGLPTLLMTYHKNTVGIFKNILKMNPDLFPGVNEHNINTINNTYRDSSVSPYINSAFVVNQILDSINTYILSDFHNLNNEYTKEELDVLNDKFFKLKKKGKYAILSKVYTEIDEDGLIVFYANRVNSLDNMSKNKLTASWQKLLREDKEIGEYLINRAYRQSGFQTRARSFHELIPTEWFMENDIAGHLADPSMTYNVDANFFDQVAANSLGRTFFPHFSKLTRIKERFFHTKDDIGRFTNEDNRIKYPLYTKDNKNVYKFIGKEMTKKDGKTFIRGIYRSIPQLSDNKTFYHKKSEFFNESLGIKSDNEYIKEYSDIVKQKNVSIFIPVTKEMQSYREDHQDRIDIMEMQETITNAVGEIAGPANTKNC